VSWRDGSLHGSSSLRRCGWAWRIRTGKCHFEGRLLEGCCSMPVWRRDDDAGPLSMRITPRGLASIGLEGDVMQLAKEPSTAEQRADGSPRRLARAVALRKKGDQGPQRAAKPGRGQSKQAKVLALLQRSQGANLGISEVRRRDRAALRRVRSEISRRRRARVFWVATGA